ERWREFHVAGLIWARERRGKTAVDVAQDPRPGTEVRRDLDNVVRPAPGDGAPRLGVGADVGAPKAVDRLFGIANHEESALAQPAVPPARRTVLSGDAKQDLRLDWVCILEFVDEDVAIALPERATDRILPAHERARSLQEIVEVENRCGAF